MALETPAWLNVKFMEKVLRKSENDDSIQVDNMTAKPATAKGDNYASDMIRTAVEYSRNISGRKVTDKKSLIVKISPTTDGFQKDIIEKIGLFKTEIEMMGSTLEKMNKLLSIENYCLSARALYTERGDPSYLVLEDLSTIGFRMADRQAGLDLHHSTLATIGLAKFHASSVALNEKDPKSLMMYNMGMYHPDHPKEMLDFFINGFVALVKEIKMWPEVERSYVEKLERLTNSCYLKGIECAKTSNEEFHVLNHGDCWVNNMLFRYNDEGKAIDHIFVDFQLPVWSSPAIDLLYFLNTSPSNDVYTNHRDSLLEIYHNTLKETMSRLSCKTQPPSMTALKKAVKDREFLGVLSSIVTLPFVLVDKSEVKSMDEIVDHTGAYDNPAYRGALFRKAMLQRIPEWNDRGLLDL